MLSSLGIRPIRFAPFFALIAAACSSSVSPDASDVDVIGTDAADAPSDIATPDVPDASIPCRAQSDCPAHTVCEYQPGCAMVEGLCHSDGCQSLPVAPQYCGCDGTTIQQTSACLPSRPYVSMGACPPRDAGPLPMRRDAVMVWTSPGGAAGWGPALRVRGTGSIEFWNMISTVPLDGSAPSAPDRVLMFDTSETDQLFQLWVQTPIGSLPHPPMGFNECYPSVAVRLCATCPTQTLSYSAPRDLLPEMNAVWNWFDSRFGSGASPSSYCAL